MTDIISIITPHRGYSKTQEHTEWGIQIIDSYDMGKGASFARNEGAKIANSDILLFKDDDVFYRGYFQDMIDIFNTKDCISIVMSQDKNDFHNNIASIHFNNRIRYNHLLLPDYINLVYGSMFAVLKEYWVPFDENIKGVEDVEFGMRLAQKGKIFHSKDITFTHAKYLTIWGLLKNDWNRTRDRVKLLLGKKMLKQALKERRFITSPLYQLLSIVTWICPPLFLWVNWGYLQFTKQKYGLLTTTKIYFLMLLDMMVVSMALVWGLLKNEKYT